MVFISFVSVNVQVAIRAEGIDGTFPTLIRFFFVFVMSYSVLLSRNFHVFLLCVVLLLLYCTEYIFYCLFLFNLQINGVPGVSAFPEADSIFSWVGTINGGKNTVYEGLKFKLSLLFPNDYPFNPPQVKFLTPCFHPNVDYHGNICLDILQVGLLSFLLVSRFLTPICKHL